MLVVYHHIGKARAIATQYASIIDRRTPDLWKNSVEGSFSVAGTVEDGGGLMSSLFRRCRHCHHSDEEGVNFSDTQLILFGSAPLHVSGTLTTASTLTAFAYSLLALDYRS